MTQNCAPPGPEPATCELCALLAGASDSVLYRNAEWAVVLVGDPAYPGFCRLVWNAHVKEMSDLAPAERARLMEALWQVELAVREVMAPDKINLASLGNQTPHLHWHVIPRYHDDAQFPNPVWAASARTTPAAILAARRALLPQLGAALAARLNALPSFESTKS
jgi:diadenosine tetraphosphate (Ap4A) HIT family hydrolase